MDEGRTIPFRPPLADAAEVGREAAGGAPIFLTIATGDRAGQARIFARSAREHHPEAQLAVVAPHGVAPAAFDNLYDLVIEPEELGIASLADMRCRYSPAELCFALKPWAIRHLLNRGTGRPVYYFDADIELFSPLVEAAAVLAHGASIVLTPHVLHSGRDQERERALLRSGSFNAGFLAVAPTEPARTFIAWWCERARTGCTHDPLEGTYGDQKWLELAPSLCEGAVVLRHPGYNVAYWNAHERPLRRGGDGWTTGNAPLRFIHYSRWNLADHEAAEYLREFFPVADQPPADLFTDYREKVRAEGGDRHEEPVARGASGWPAVVRNAYARHAPAIDGASDAVEAHAIAVLNATSVERPMTADLPMTVLYDDIWRHHGELRYRCAIDLEGGRLAFLRWLVETGAAELCIPAVFLKSARSAIERQRVRDLESGNDEAEPEPETQHRAVDHPEPAETVAGLLAAHDAERERRRQQEQDIRLLVSSNKALRRELQSLRVRAWRDEERIAALEAEHARTRHDLDAMTRRARQLAGAVPARRERRWRPLLRLVSGKNGGAAPSLGRQILPGDKPLSQAGFRLGDAAVITAGSTVKRRVDAPSGMVLYGPYLKLAPGTYAASIAARLYRGLPLATTCKLDVVYDGGQQVAGLRQCRLYSPAGWRRFSLPFTVIAGDEDAEFEIRVWGRKGTPLEIAEIELHELLP